MTVQGEKLLTLAIITVAARAAATFSIREFYIGNCPVFGMLCPMVTPRSHFHPMRSFYILQRSISDAVGVAGLDV